VGLRRVARCRDASPATRDNPSPRLPPTQADFYEQHLFISLARFAIKAPSALLDPRGRASHASSFGRRSHEGAAGGRSGGGAAAAAEEAGGGGGERRAVHPSRAVELRASMGRRPGPGASRARGAVVGEVLPMELTVEQVKGQGLCCCLASNQVP
jgi:hypothetical protein